ncbi:DNA polymerase III subunit delta' [Weissella paramesenteroides]|uniref:DNA polymerase III subunit delta' n=1 Tax=Weissella paramesenteroides TaxID=1249 RepID=UPI0013DBF1AE|nr:DNA polymerase III subunit delta' [Weissella paramesenteroides]MCT0485022.1 DNA polymerase III subunit delta' [Weissella paramesenteroides]NEZ89415.1 DNA polymerase III subunit delta' [Weissella paramesenteroides]NFB03741.1 DNA polymerase III subunit delta' [Weissella paramesenteroides]WEA52707.1 DNA polymerase III subunit delta' [Weissella paramesenteroides]
MNAKKLIARVMALQPQLIAQLQKALASQQLAHAFLFTGPAGRGQELVADWLAMRLMCQHVTADGQPDGTCDQCQRIVQHEHPDVIEVHPDGKSIKVDQVRFLKEEFTKTAVEGQQKIFIVSGADTMTTSAANGLLKFIEEPAPGQTAILIAENRAQILPTIISRTQVIAFAAVGNEQFEEELLSLGYHADEVSLVQSLTDSKVVAEEWLTDDWFRQATQATSSLVSAILKNSDQAFTLAQTLYVPLAIDIAHGKTLLMMLAQAWRDILLLKTGVQNSHFANDWSHEVQHFETKTLLAVINIVLSAPQRLEKNINFQTTLEATILESQFKLAGLS